MQRISKSTVSKIDMSKETESRDISDAEIRGFGIRIRPGSSPTFYFRYQSPKFKKIRRISIGSTSHIELETARDIAREYRGHVARGIDPADEKERPSKFLTVADLYDRYWKEHVLVRNKPETQHDVDYLWNKYILPKWSQLSVSAITRGDTISLLASIKSKTVSNRVRSYISKAFNLAEAWELRPNGTNPCRHIPKFRELARDRSVMPEELRRIWHAIERFWIKEHPVAVLSKLMLLTGARRGELQRAKLSDIDWERKVLILPDSKTGKAEIELTDAAIDVIKSAIRHGKSNFIVPGYTPGKPLKSPQGGWVRIRKSAGSPDLRLHDLRHIFGTYAHHAGANQRQIMDLLRHTTFQMSERYVQGFKTARRQGAEKTVNAILGFIGDEDSTVERTKNVASNEAPVVPLNS